MIDNVPAFIFAWAVVLVWDAVLVYLIDAYLEARKDDQCRR